MVSVTWKSAGDLVVCVPHKNDKGQSSTIILTQGVNRLTPEQWANIKGHPQVKALLEAEDLVLGLDQSVENAELAKKLKKSIVEMSSKEARDMIPTVVDRTTLETWMTQENKKGGRQEVLFALRNQLKLVRPAVAA